MTAYPRKCHKPETEDRCPGVRQPEKAQVIVSLHDTEGEILHPCRGPT